MNAVEDLLHPDKSWPRGLALPAMDPLRERDALQEAQVLDVRFDAVRSTVGLLFEMRIALQLHESNTGVLVVRDVRTLSWNAEAGSTARTAWNVVGSTPQARGGVFGLTLGTSPNAWLSLQGGAAAFFTGDVPGLGQIPDYGSNAEAAVRAGNRGLALTVHADSRLLRDLLRGQEGPRRRAGAPTSIDARIAHRRRDPHRWRRLAGAHLEKDRLAATSQPRPLVRALCSGTAARRGWVEVRDARRRPL